MTWERGHLLPSDFKLPVYLFDVQREKCAACRHQHIASTKLGVSLFCHLQRPRIESCSVMRGPDEACGPEALGFKARA